MNAPSFRRILAGAAAPALALSLSGCGSSGSPSAPSTPPPTPAPVQNYAGSYSGTYDISQCGHTGDWPPCSDFFDGTGAPIALTLTQTGDQVSGTLTLGNVVRSVAGKVRSDSHLVLDGTTTMNSNGVPITFTLVGWDTQLSGSLMTGGWKEHITSTVLGGFLQWVSTIDSVVKTSSHQMQPSTLGRGRANGTIPELLGITK